MVSCSHHPEQMGIGLRRGCEKEKCKRQRDTRMRVLTTRDNMRA